MVHPAFQSLLVKRELIILFGRRYKNLLWLSLIFFITFLTIGFSNGSLEYLALKMKSPFVNWINISIPYAYADRMNDLIALLNQKEIKEQYEIKSVNGYHEFTMNFTDQKDDTRVLIGRSINFNDPALTEIMAQKNLIKGRSFTDENEIGLIITKSFISEIGFDTTASFVYYRFSDSENGARSIPLPVIAVVNELPGRHAFATTPFMYSMLNQSPSGSPFNPFEDKELMIFTSSSKTLANELKTDLEAYFKQQTNKIHKPFILPVLIENKDSWKTGFVLKITFSPQPASIEVIDSIFNSIEADKIFAKHLQSIERYYNYRARFTPISELKGFDNLSVNFSGLSKVRDFASLLASHEFALKIDMAQIESKENYDFVSRLTRISSLILLLFSIYAISMFLANLLRMHIERIKMNLGTLMAFGISNKMMQNLYALIAFRFVSVAMSIGLLAAYIFGYLGGVRILLFISQAGLEWNQLYFSLWNIWTLITILATWLFSLFAVRLALHKVLHYSPGDLVYDRID